MKLNGKNSLKLLGHLTLVVGVMIGSASLLEAKPKTFKTKSKAADLTKFFSWGINPQFSLSHINLDKAKSLISRGKKSRVKVAVIDTGIDASHPLFSNSVSPGKDFSKGNVNPNNPADSHGHGTHVAGIIKSVDPNVQIIPLKYYNPKASGQDNLNSTIKALRYAVDLNVDIINYSGGGPESSNEEKKILKEAEKKGILVVAAAGNEESNIDKSSNAYFPASYAKTDNIRNILTVTAHDQNLKVLSSSNYGKSSVDLSAPGFRIRSSIPHNRAGYMTGTSQATAFVTGVASLIKSRFPILTALDLKAIIKNSARSNTHKNLLGKCSTSGKLNAYDAFQKAKIYVKSLKNNKKLASKKKGRSYSSDEKKKTSKKPRFFKIIQ